MNLNGASFVWEKQNKKFFLFQKLQLTNVEDNTNVQFVDTRVGCKEEDHLLKVFIENFSDQNFYFEKKIVDDLLSVSVIFFSLTIEKE